MKKGGNKMIKKAKVIAGICLMGQSLIFFVLFIAYWNRSRSLAKTLAVFSAVGGVSGALLVLSELREKKLSESINRDFEAMDEMFDEDFANAEDVSCSFGENE